MLKTLIKKQLLELNRSFFYNNKSGKMRSKGSSAAFIILYVVLMVGVLGGSFTYLSVLLCKPFTGLGLEWLYFDMMVLIALMLGVFGSVFNTYSSLYKAKDNDLTLSLPIPTKYILVARLLGVYLMGLMFSAVVMLPADIVYFVVARPGFAGVFGALWMTLLISVFVFILSCLLGWVVAKISTHLKNKSLVTVLLCLVFFGLYYFVCFNAYELIQELIINALTIGESIENSAYVLYMIGAACAGERLWLLVVTLVISLLAYLTYRVLERSFLKLATASGKTAKRVYREKAAKVRSVRAALLGRELTHLLGNATYMLNCALGTPLLIIAGVAILIYGSEFTTLAEMLQFPPEFLPVMFSIGLCMVSSMVDLTAPSVSLEGKGIWIAQSLPVPAKQVLRVKLDTSLIVGGIPTLFCAVCVVILFKPDVLTGIMCVILPCVFFVTLSALGLIINLLRPNLSWQDPTVPVKQSIGVLISLFGGWVLAAIIGVAYFLLCTKLAGGVFLLLASIVLLIISAFELKWLDTKGSRIFMYL